VKEKRNNCLLEGEKSSNNEAPILIP